MLGIRDRISKVRQSSDARTVASNFAWLTVLQIAGYAFPLISMPYLARTIGVEGFSKVAFAMAIMVFVQTVSDWGFNLSATRDVAQNRDNPDKVSRIFSNVLWARLLLMCLSFVILTALVMLVPKMHENAAVIMVTFLMIPGHILFPDWFFQAMEKMKYITIFNVTIKFLFTVAVFIFIKTPEDYIIQPLLNAIAFAVCGVISLYLIIVRWKVQVRMPVLKDVLKTIKGSTNIFINELMPNLYNSFSTMLLGFWGNGSAVGILDGGEKFIFFGKQMLSMLSRAFYPFLSRRLDKHRIFVNINLLLGTLMALMFFLCAPLLVRVFLSPEFASSVYVIRIRAITMLFYALSNAYGANYLILVRKERLLRQITTICSLVGFCLAWPLVYYFGYIGAAVTTTTSIGLIAAATCIAAGRLKKI